MCGIAGILRWEGDSPTREEITSMIKAVSHRGPDGEGIIIHNKVALAHRRLTIIDPEFGAQPMSNAEKNVIITYNGEIYNYKEITSILKAKGYRFLTRSDTEVIIHAYKEWGVECLNKLRGMFAFCILDIEKQCIILARDHYGIKPLMYRIGNNYIAFASEINALKKVHDIKPNGDIKAIEYYLRYQYIPDPITIYENVYKLPPAMYMKIDFNGKIEKAKTYWSLVFNPCDSIKEKEWIEMAREALEESVRAHMVSDVPYGVFISGGIDSTLIAANMAKIYGEKIRAFTIAFEEEELSELKYAKEAAEKLGLELHYEIIKDSSLRIVSDAIEGYGEPFGDNSFIAVWYLSRLAREFVPMVLSGDGADEAFGGYKTYSSFVSKRERSRFSYLQSLLNLSGMGLGNKKKDRINKLSDWEKIIYYYNEKERYRLWRPEFRFLLQNRIERMHSISQKYEEYDILSYAQCIDLCTYLPSNILRKVDVASMSHGLEVRVPFIDIKVTEMFSRLPFIMKFRHNGKGTITQKYLLKTLLKNDFQYEYINRKKRGFSIPLAKWFSKDGEGYNRIKNISKDQNSQIVEWFDDKIIKEMLVRQEKNRSETRKLWLLYILDTWLQQNNDIKFN